MADFLIQATLSNLVVATLLAVIAWVVQRRIRSASLANLLWALVLIKMVTPPLISFPVFEVPSISSVNVQQRDVLSTPVQSLILDHEKRSLKDISTVAGQSENLTTDGLSQSTAVGFGARIGPFVITFSLVVSAILLVLSAFRILRFHWLLKANSRVHDELSLSLSTSVAKQLGLQRHPNIVVSTANIAPFVWWMAGRAIIVVSEHATQKLTDEDIRFIISHEMAHIKRRDHWFRWLEWMALIGFWWNPVMWWARTQLRMTEEIACDDLVLETTNPKVHRYANSLLNMAELLTSPTIRPPVVASAINSGGSLEKRLKMMIAEKTWKVPSALRLAIVAMATCVFPLGVVYAQDFEAVERRLGGAIEAGELSLEQANLMMEALRRSNTSREMEAKKRRYMEFAREIEGAVEAGKLSREEAEAKLIAVRREMFEEKSEGEDRGISVEDYRRGEAQIRKAIEKGEVSKEDAEKRLIEMRKAIRSEKPEDDNRGISVEDYRRAESQIREAVEKGEVSKEDAEKRLIEMRKIIRSEK